MASRDKKRSINKRNKKKFYTTTKSKVACTKRRRSLTKFGKMTAAAEPTKPSVGYDLVKGLVKGLVKENGSNVGLQKLIDKDFPFVSKMEQVKDPKPISIPRNSEVFKRYQKSILKIRKTY